MSEATEAAINALLDHYPPDAHVKRVMVAGSYLTVIDHAKALTQDRWAETYGEQFRPFPDTFGVAYELLDFREKVAAIRRHERIASSLTPKARKIIAHVERLQPYTPFTYAAPAYLKLQAYQRAFDIARYSPDLRVPQGVKSGPHIPNEGLERSRANAVCTFVSNLLYYRPDTIAPQDFDSLAAQGALSNHEHGFNRSYYNLAWMLGMLTTSFATGSRVHTLTTIGCDFKDIEDKVLAPPRRRYPGLEATLNVFIASVDRLGSVHPVGIVGNTEDGSVIVNDPQYNEPKVMSSEDFWYHWTAANMQAEITLARPIHNRHLT